MLNFTQTFKNSILKRKGHNILNFIIVLLIVNFFFSSAAFSQIFSSYTYTSDGTFVAPAGVTSVSVEAWGGGGKGGNADGSPIISACGAGGGGGACSFNGVNVCAPLEYKVTVGQGGSGSTKDGGDSWFGSVTTVLAKGGEGAILDDKGLGGSVIYGYGYEGGDGSDDIGGFIDESGGGGGGAGTWMDGSNGAGMLGGNGGSAGGGDGGEGLAFQGSGNSGQICGGGGSGAWDALPFTSRNGGNGGRGAVKVLWYCPTYSLTSVSGLSFCGTITSITLNGLPEGTFTVTYNTTNPTQTGHTASMNVITAGTGSFTATGLTGPADSSSTITITYLTSGSTPDGYCCGNDITSNNTTIVDKLAGGQINTYPGTALDFDGGNDYVSTSIDVNPTVYPTMTWEAWVYPTRESSVTWQFVFSHDDQGWDRTVSIRNSSFWEVHTGSGYWEAVEIDLNTWQHIAVVFDDANNKLYFYKNGIQYEYTDTTNFGSSNLTLNIGRSPEDQYYFQGKIEEGRIWDVARTETEIRENMHLPLSGTETGLISYWQFNEGSGTQTYDDISGNHGTLQNMSSIWVPSTIPFGTGFAHSQAEVNDTVVFTGTGISMDFQIAGMAEITVSRIDTVPNILPSGLIDDLDEQYWVVNRYGTDDFEADITFAVTEDLTTEDENNPSKIRLYTRSSTSDLEWMLLDSADLVNASDNTATFEGITGFSQFIIGKIVDPDIDGFPGTALEFDGMNGYIECGNIGSIGIDNEMTIEAWIKISSSFPAWARVGNIIGNYNHSPHFNFEVYSDGKLRLYWNSNEVNALSTGIDLRDNTWHHVAVTRNFGTDQIILYIDGEENVIFNAGSNADFQWPLRIGNDFRTAGHLFNGLIEEVRLWNSARSEQQIRENMHLPLSGTETGLISYWQLNDSTGTQAVDLISGNHGTLRNMVNSDWVASTIPFGAGFADSQNEASVNLTFEGTGLSMDFALQHGAEITVSRIDFDPNLLPFELATDILDDQYWVVNRYGDDSFVANLTFTIAEEFTMYDENHPSNILLYSRLSTSDTEWGIVASASSVSVANNEATFDVITGFGQFILGKFTFAELDLKVFLEGPFNGFDMNTSLNSSQELPLNQPYTNQPWRYQGTDSVIVFPNPDIVDWVLVELRDAQDAPDATTAPYIARQAAFILKDGSVVDMDGSTNLVFDVDINEQLFVVVWHRNHLGIMSAMPLAESGRVSSYDFSIADGQAYGTGSQKDLGIGVYGMITGDANANGIINDTDKDPVWYTQAGIAGYLSADLNMDGQCNNMDKDDYWFPNQGDETQVSFTYGPCPGVPTVTYEGQTYNTVQIGTQCWFKENLNVGTIINGSEDMSDDGIIEKYCYDNDPANCDTYGGMYQWNEMMQYTSLEQTQGICPEGWHLPSDEEWKQLEGEVDSQYEYPDPEWDLASFRGFDAGLNIKSFGNGINSSGFSVLPGGIRSNSGDFDYLGEYGDFWASTTMDGANYLVWRRLLYYYNNKVGRYDGFKEDGRSVRCLQD